MSRDSSAPAVVGTKLRVPSPRPEQVLRPRLMEMLEAGLEGKVTLVSAPAGYGKTILLSQWLTANETNSAFAWVSLDEQDNAEAGAEDQDAGLAGAGGFGFAVAHIQSDRLTCLGG